MTKKNRTIWHNPDEVPSRRDYIIVYVRGGTRPLGYFSGDWPILMPCNIYEPISEQVMQSGRIIKWTYLSDFKKISTALDAAMASLNAIKDWDLDNPKQPFFDRPYLVRAIQNFSKNKLKEIESYIKGQK